MATPIEQEGGNLLHERKLTLATAESATGGLISGRILNVPGSSSYFKGGVVAYWNGAKRDVLGVKQETLDAHGSVSRQTAKEMAEGVRRLMKVDLALSDTAVAGPGGGTDKKPVGLFYIGLATPEGSEVQEHRFKGDRQENREQAVQAALAMLKEYLVKSK